MHEKTLCIVTPTVPSRVSMYQALFGEIARQIGARKNVSHIGLFDGCMESGLKMEALLKASIGDYVACVDDDDWIAEDYVAELCAAIQQGPDVVTFNLHRINPDAVWFLRANEKDWQVGTDGVVMRANHLCAWRRDLVLSSCWIPVSGMCDVPWYTLLGRGIEPATEVHIDKVLYEYRFDRDVTLSQAPQKSTESLRLRRGGLTGWRTPDGRLALSWPGMAEQRNPNGLNVLLPGSEGRTVQMLRGSLVKVCDIPEPGVHPGGWPA